MTADSCPKPTVLIIDDDVQIRRLLRVSLEAANHAVGEAASGQEGLIAAAHRRPVWILTEPGVGYRLTASHRAE